MKLRDAGFDHDCDPVPGVATRPAARGMTDPRAAAPLRVDLDGDDDLPIGAGWWLAPMVIAGGAVWAAILF